MVLKPWNNVKQCLSPDKLIRAWNRRDMENLGEKTCSPNEFYDLQASKSILDKSAQVTYC